LSHSAHISANTVTEDALAPTVHVLVPAQAGLLFSVAWMGYDAGAGIAGFDVEYQVGVQAMPYWVIDTERSERSEVQL
jgi:hypothetical protein